jgi:fumarylacetoacetase
MALANMGLPSAPRVVVRIGDHVVDLFEAGIEPGLTGAPVLNSLMASRRGREVRLRAADVLTGPQRWDVVEPVGAVEVLLPFTVGDYVDFYSSIHHAENLGRMMRPDSDPILPNWRHLPVGYHGRSGTVRVSGTDVVRPEGLVPDGEGVPRLTPTRALDIELEVGFVVGHGGTRIRPDDADRHVFGVVLLNDWSARDIQAFEYQPLGPNLAKSFATTISPWVVTLDALRPYLVPGPEQDPTPDPYLQMQRPWALDLHLDPTQQPHPHASSSIAQLLDLAARSPPPPIATATGARCIGPLMSPLS